MTSLKMRLKIYLEGKNRIVFKSLKLLKQNPINLIKYIDSNHGF